MQDRAEYEEIEIDRKGIQGEKANEGMRKHGE